MPLDTVAGLFDRVRINLGRGSQTTIVTMIPDWVNLIQRSICREGKWWFCFTEVSSSTLSTSTDTVNLPSDFLDEEYVFLKDSAGNINEIFPMENMERRKEYTDLTGDSYEALPINYLIRSSDILFRPIADQDYTLILGYWKELADLVSGGSTNDLLLTYPDVLETGGTYKAFEYMQQYEDANYWKGRHMEELTKMRVANAERELPGEFVLSIRPGQRSTRIGNLRRRNFY